MKYLRVLAIAAMVIATLLLFISLFVYFNFGYVINRQNDNIHYGLAVQDGGILAYSMTDQGGMSGWPGLSGFRIVFNSGSLNLRLWLSIQDRSLSSYFVGKEVFVPLWIPAVVFVFVFMSLRGVKPLSNCIICSACGYSLEGIYASICPECGYKDRHRLGRRRRPHA